ncbi:S8 family peptidase [Nocardia africana]|uniref:S8 family peptidase n=1 Tax=Nocardia africana TaxID=134964 RepID=A0ABW6NNN8_9NOCA
MDPEQARFDPRHLYGSVIAAPLLDEMREQPASALHKVVIDLHFGYPAGRAAAAQAVRGYIQRATDTSGDDEGVDDGLAQYVLARLTANSIREVVRLDRAAAETGAGRAIYRIWPDFTIGPLINRSAATVKADAAHASFTARGAGIVWAVIDSGIDGRHMHFRTHGTLDVTLPVRHLDCTGGNSPLTDEFGHGTHVAGIIAGEGIGTTAQPLNAVRAEIDDNGDVHYRGEPVTDMAAMAPLCRLVGYKVLDDGGDGQTSSIMAALEDIQEVNNHGRDIKIHGVNLSVGYPFDPKWFACGESPVCQEVTRLVHSGVVVVVAAGNTGYGYNLDFVKGNVGAGLDLTINDPGNAEMALTVGSTHRDMPHRYGISYFSSKGPTGDGRAKPDLVAPGERILSCATGRALADIAAKGDVTGPVDYVEDSGTSMAAAHVSGVVAAFLSVRREYIGDPGAIKTIFTDTATDLGRMTNFQGHGLIDLMRAIQSV